MACKRWSVEQEGKTSMNKPEKAISNARWVMLGMCFLGTTINYIDRANLGVAAPLIQHELGLGPAALGVALGAFFWTYAVMQMPSGWLVDRFGARAMYATVVVLWSLFTMATAAARGLATLIGARLLLGVGEAGAYPTNAKVTGLWFPTRERALASAIFDTGSRVGTALSVPIVTVIIVTMGWRASFIITGLLGFIWLVAWLAIYRNPGAADVAFARSGEAETATPETEDRIRWIDLFRYRTLLGMMLGAFCFNFANYFFLTWFPTYLIQARGLSLPSVGVFGGLPALCAIPAGPLGGWVSDHLLRSGWSLTAARKTCLVGGMLVSTSITLAAFVPSATVAIALFCLAFASLAFTNASVWSLPADVAPSKGQIASIAGIQNFASNFAGICIATFTGVMVALTHGSFVVPLVVGGIILVIGAASYLFIVGQIRPLPILPKSRPAT
jgi:D-galactonate transporter